eukprot:GHVU01117101.1.p1 GENE.GHVU01117101.1~~GHVU01117101.1.p1  ORF type:complete len:120 (+),score=9.57 GHVU01117101.1:292-651(+)
MHNVDDQKNRKVEEFHYTQMIDPPELQIGTSYTAPTILNHFAKHHFSDWFTREDGTLETPTAEGLDSKFKHFVEVKRLFRYLDPSNNTEHYTWRDSMQFLLISPDGKQPGTGADVALLS